MTTASNVFTAFLYYASYLVCLASLITLYYVPTLSTFVLASFCVGLGVTILYKLYDDASLVESFCDLSSNPIYIINTILTVVDYMVCFGVFVATLHLFDHYDQTDHDQSDRIASYLMFVAIYVFFQWFRDFVGAIVEVYISSDAGIVSGRTLDKDVKDKSALKLAKLVRLYIFEKPEGGISLGYNFPSVNFTHLFNPLPLVVGISLIVFSNALKEHDANELIHAMDYNFNIISIGIIIHLCINFVLILLYTRLMCMITDSCKFHMMGFVLTSLLFLKSLYLYLITMFYKGFSEYLYETTIGKSHDLSFIFYVVACVAIVIGLKLVFLISAKCAESKIRNIVDSRV